MHHDRLKRIRQRFEVHVQTRCPDCGGPMPAPQRVVLEGHGWSEMDDICCTCIHPRSVMVRICDDIPERLPI